MIKGSISSIVRALHTIPDELFRKEKLSEIPKLPDFVISTIGKYFTSLPDAKELGEARNIIAFEKRHDVIALVTLKGARYFPVTSKEYEESKKCTFSNQRLSSKEHDILEKMRQEMQNTWQVLTPSTADRFKSPQCILDVLNTPALVDACKDGRARIRQKTVTSAFLVPPLEGKTWHIAFNIEIPKQVP